MSLLNVKVGRRLRQRVGEPEFPQARNRVESEQVLGRFCFPAGRESGMVAANHQAEVQTECRRVLFSEPWQFRQLQKLRHIGLSGASSRLSNDWIGVSWQRTKTNSVFPRPQKPRRADAHRRPDSCGPSWHPATEYGREPMDRDRVATSDAGLTARCSIRISSRSGFAWTV